MHIMNQLDKIRCQLQTRIDSFPTRAIHITIYNQNLLGFHNKTRWKPAKIIQNLPDVPSRPAGQDPPSFWSRSTTAGTAMDSYEPDPIADEVLASEIASMLHMMQTGDRKWFRENAGKIREERGETNVTL